MKVIDWEAEALAEFDDALLASPTPVKFRAEVNAAAAAIAANPQCAALAGRSKSIRQYVLTRPPYSIIYADEPQTIRIIALAHHSRRPGYWKSRLRRP